MKRVFLLLTSFFLVSFAEAQFGLAPPENDFAAFFIHSDQVTQYNSHPSVRPPGLNEIDSINDRYQQLNFQTRSKWLGYFVNADTVKPQKDLIRINIAPVLQARYATGKSNDTTDQAYQFGLGVAFNGFVGRNFTFNFIYQYSRNQYADYVQQYVQTKKVVPGMGRGEVDGDEVINRYSSGYAEYRATDFLKLRAGVGKHFYGSGYRSLLLSDNSFVYPYFLIDLDIWKLKYRVLYSRYTNILYGGDLYGPYRVVDEVNKYSTSNFLSMNMGKRWNVGLFQSVIWQGENDLNRGFDVNYLNPVVFMRPVEFSIGSPDNILLGLDASYRFPKKGHTIYGQFILDEFLLSEVRANNGWWGNKYGAQVGFKLYDLFNIKGLMIQGEKNIVRPFTYSHGNAFQNYSHGAQELAHPLGANFNETVARIYYRKNRFLFNAQITHARKGEDYDLPADGTNNFGGNIFMPNTTRSKEYGNELLQGMETELRYARFMVSYLISPDSRWVFDVGVSRREKINHYHRNEGRDETNVMFEIGIRTLLTNQYLDF